jgi:hypothetical protein
MCPTSTKRFLCPWISLAILPSVVIGIWHVERGHRGWHVESSLSCQMPKGAPRIAAVYASVGYE